MADRNKNYIPDDLHLPAPWKYEVRGELRQATWGKADELNRDQGNWDWIDTSKDHNGNHWSEFKGHREQVDVEIHTSNGHEVNDWKGRDEIRKHCHWRVSLDRVAVGEGFHPDPLEALLAAREYITKASVSSGLLPIRSWRDAGELVGRKIYYRDQPAIITSIHTLDQGCIMIEAATENGRFTPPAYVTDKGSSSDEAGYYDDVAEGEKQREKVEFLSDKIWWYRES